MQIKPITFALAALLAHGIASANLISNGSFEEPVVTNGQFDFYSAGQSIGAWTVDPGSYFSDVVSNTYTGGVTIFPTPFGNQFSYLADGYGASSISQHFSAAITGSYSLTFSQAEFVGSNGRMTADIRRGDDSASLVGSPILFTTAVNSGFVNQELDFNISSAGDYIVRLASYPGTPGIVDNVSIQTTPEPASIVALAIGAGAIIRRRRK